MLKRLRLKFICIILTIVAVMLCAIFGLTIQMTRQNLEESSLRAMQQMASTPGFLPDRFNTPIGDDAQPISCFSVTRLVDGRLSATGSAGIIPSENAVLEDLWNQAEACSESTGIIEEYALRFLRVSSPLGNRYIFADSYHEQLALEVLYRNCAAIGITIFLLFIPVSMLLAGWSIKPVEQAWKQQRQFVADASHELKTPLTVILTNAELLQTASHDAAARQRFAESIHSTAQQMRHLVEGLLELARADNAAVSLQREQIDLSALAESCILPFEAVFFEQDLWLDSLLTPGITVSGDGPKLKQVLDILLDNARKYAAPGQVCIRLHPHPKGCLFSIRTPGQPISREDLTKIFHRFYRTDAARSRDGSYGLGLSIAQHIVQSHGGKIWAESSEGGNTFFIQLPVI